MLNPEIIRTQIEITPKCSSLIEEFIECITYMVQQFACEEDAERIKIFFQNKENGYHFVGKSTKMSFKIIQKVLFSSKMVN